MSSEPSALAARLGLETELVLATDPFFAPTARGRAALQRIKGLKHELVVSIPRRPPAGDRVVQRSRAFFGESFEISLPMAAPASSGCVAFGIERWLLAVLVTHGIDPTDWPHCRSGGLTPPHTLRSNRHMTITSAQSMLPLYVRSAAAADRGGWSVERDIKWSDIDRERAHARPDLLAALRDAALIESYHPVNLARLLRATLGRHRRRRRVLARAV